MSRRRAAAPGASAAAAARSRSAVIASAGADPLARGMRLLLGAALVLTPIVFVPGLVEGFEMPKAGVVRVLGLGALALAIGGGAFHRRRWAALDVAVLVWLAVELLASAVSRAPWISVMGDRSQHEGLVTSVALAGLYLAARCATADVAAARRALGAFVAGTSGAAIYAALQVVRLDPLGWQRTATYGAGAQLRPFGTLGHANMLGPLTAAALIVALLLLRDGSRARRILLAIAAALLAAVTFVTLSRAAWLGALAGLAVAALLAPRDRRWLPEARGARLAALATAAAVVVAAALVLFASGWGRLIARRMAEMLSPASGSSRSRLEIWRAAWAMIRDRPWIGQGPDTFAMRYSTFQTPAYWRYEWGGLPVHAHSIYLHVLATRGILGALAGLACLVAGAVALRRAWRAGREPRPIVAALAGAAACLAIAGGFGALGITGALLLAAGSGILASMADGGWTIGEDRDPAAARAAEPRAVPPARRRGASVAAALVMALVLLGTIRELRAERAATLAYLELMASHEGGGDLGFAASSSGRAWAALPQQDSYSLLHAQCLLALASMPGAPPAALPAAERAARAAVQHGPLRAANWQALAFALGARAANGDTAVESEARRAWEREHALAPYDADALLQDADLQIRMGHTGPALQLARHAAQLYPHDGPTLFKLSGAEGWAGDSLAARATLERAVGADWRGDDADRRVAEAVLDSLRRVSPSR